MKTPNPMSSSLSIERPKTLTDLVTDRVRQAIVDGELPFGSAVSEDALANVFSVSRTPVRDALSQLQREGVIDIIPKRGSFVFTPDEQDIVKVCEYRLMLETRAANLSMKYDPEGLFAAMERELATMAAAFEAKDARKYGRADWRYHAALFTHCDNPYMCDAYALAAAKFTSLSTNVSRPFPDQRTTSFNEHRLMLAHLRETRLDAFERVLTDHIGRTRNVYLQALERKALAKPSGAEVLSLRLNADSEE